jgi:hypothetical protein
MGFVEAWHGAQGAPYLIVRIYSNSVSQVQKTYLTIDAAAMTTKANAVTAKSGPNMLYQQRSRPWKFKKPISRKWRRN